MLRTMRYRAYRYGDVRRYIRKEYRSINRAGEIRDRHGIVLGDIRVQGGGLALQERHTLS